MPVRGGVHVSGCPCTSRPGFIFAIVDVWLMKCVNMYRVALWGVKDPQDAWEGGGAWG